MRDVRRVCSKCGRTFLWTHEERMDGLKSMNVREMLDTRKFKVQIEKIKIPSICGGCRLRFYKRP